ncbi:MAG TPA: hypothetical protein VFH33_02285, partial [Candidatus Krumholzibacteria bacterium]|nr:hypothetical protein [Candidatus Krumholzibacteria bacterium]
MQIRLHIFSASALALLVALASCGEDTPTASGPVDLDAPAITGVTPIDAHHLAVVFDSQVSRSSAEKISNYTIVESDAANAIAAPGDPVYVTSAVLQADQTTVSLSTYLPMSGMNLRLSVDGVSDLKGNTINTASKDFTGSGTPDLVAPSIDRSNPA